MVCSSPSRVQVAVQRRQSPDAVTRGLELGLGFGQPDAACLQVQQARDDLQVVLHPVMDLLHQQILVRYGAAQLSLSLGESPGRLGEGVGQFRDLARHPGEATRSEMGLLPAIADRPSSDA